MNQYYFDFRGLWYAVRLITVFVSVVFLWTYVARHTDLFFADPESQWLSPVFTHRPVLYKELADGTVIFANHEEVLKKRDQFNQEKRDFIFADLKEMKLVVYRSGVEKTSFPIQAKGREGSFFETPSGVYRVQSKESNHFSSIGQVWMPWSMHFFGNYFIHGWPYYPNGKPVAETFSGGCIRLTSEDAKAIFGIIKTDMPVLVYAKSGNAQTDLKFFQKVSDSSSLSLTAPSVLAVDFDSGQILYEKEKTVIHPIASLTKLMTALVAVETINRFKTVTVTQSAVNTEGTAGDLVVGETFKSEDLLYPLLLTSSNDAATLYAEQTYNFVPTMNEKAQAIGMANTHFEDPSGLDPRNVSTTEDIFKLLRFIYLHKKPIFEISSLKHYVLSSLNKTKTHDWFNLNWPVTDPRFVAGKSGTIPEAGKNMTGVYRLKLSEQGERSVAIIVLHSEDRKKDIETIIKYLESNFVYGTVLTHRGKNPETIPAVAPEGAAVYQAL